MSLAAFAPSMQHTYLFTNFVWSTYGSPWLQASTTGALGPLAQKTTLAFAQATFARHHHRTDIAFSGAKSYGEVITAVRTDLSQHADRDALAALLAPVTILLMHAASTPAAERAATANHVMGLFALLKITGPKGFRCRPLRDAFSSCRATLVICGLLQKQRLFLEDKDWRVVPWELEPDAKRQQDRLVDVLVRVPGLLQDQTRLLEFPNDQGRKALASEVFRSLKELFAWRWAWEAQNAGSVWEEDRTEASGNASNPPIVLRQLLVFASFTAAVEIALYNAVLLCLLGLLFSELSPSEAQTHISVAVSRTKPEGRWQANPGLTLPSTPLYLRAAAIEIVRAFEYQLKHARSTQESALFWLFPFGLAGKVLQEDKEMTAWIQQMLDESDVTRGYGRGDNAFGFGLYTLPKVDERPAEKANELMVLLPE